MRPPCRGAYEEAVKSFEAALALRWSARALFHLGNAQFALRQYGSAEGSYSQALAVRHNQGFESRFGRCL